MNPERRRLLVAALALGGIALGGALPTYCASRAMRRGPPAPPPPPRRPAGTPKPMRDEDIAPLLARLDAWYAAHLAPDRRYRLRPPADPAALARFETAVGLKMPRSWHQLYRWHDGEDDDRFGHIYGLPLLPVETALRDWKDWNRVLAGFGGNRYPVPGGGWPVGAVDPAYVNPRRIPLTADGSGNHIGLDFDPWPGGRVGQVILYGRDEDVKVVLADSLGNFLGWIADLLEGGNFRLGVAPGEQVLREFRLNSPRVDGFHEGARLMLGAPGQFL